MFVVQVRQRARGRVGTMLSLWSVVMAVVLFLGETHWGSRGAVELTGVVATALLGAYLGWRRSLGAVLVAPVVSWLAAWLPLWVAAMIHDGLVRGLFVGLFLVTIGWIGVAVSEVVWLGLVGLVVRALHGRGHDPDVVVIGPDRS